MTAATFDRSQWRLLADGLAVAVAAAIPWSTSVAYILIGLWVLSLFVAVVPREWRDVLPYSAVWLPLVLIAVAALGMLWASGTAWSDRLEGVATFVKLGAIPLLFVQFRHSPRGHWVFIGFLASCTLLLLASWMMVVAGMKAFTGGATSYGVPVRDYIVQSQEFILCAIGLSYVVYLRMRERRYGLALAFAGLAALFLINVMFVAPSRTGLVTVPVLFAILVIAHCRWTVSLAIVCVIAALAAAAFAGSTKIQKRISGIVTEVQDYRMRGKETSAGQRYDFWTTSLDIVAKAPVIGHGTGAVHDSFIRAAAERGSSKPATTNPHNQTLTVAIQLGAIGVLLLYAMWGAHALLFRCGGLVGWIGLAVVAQNVIGSLFNNHLFDFAQSWIYLIGVGVAGGMVLARRAETMRSAATPP